MAGSQIELEIRHGGMIIDQALADRTCPLERLERLVDASGVALQQADRDAVLRQVRLELGRIGAGLGKTLADLACPRV